MVTKKAAQTTVKPSIVKDPATFPAAQWLEDLAATGFKPRNVRVPLHIRGDLLPRIQQLVAQIQANESANPDIGIDDDDPMAEVAAEYERLVAEFRAGGTVDFVFRPMNRKVHDRIFTEWREEFPEADDDARELLILRRMAAHCIEYPGMREGGPQITAEAFQIFEDAYGSPAFNTLVQGFLEAYEAGGEVDAPFSPMPSRTRATTK